MTENFDQGLDVVSGNNSQGWQQGNAPQGGFGDNQQARGWNPPNNPASGSGNQGWNPVGNQGQGFGGQTNQGGLLGGPLHEVRQGIQGQINQAVDHYASQIPGGERFSPEAKQAIAGILDNLQNQLESHARTSFGAAADGLLGNPQGNQGNQGNQGGQL